MSRIGSVVVLALLAACSSQRPPSAAPRANFEARRASLSYLAPPPCPGDAGFIEHVRSRSTRLQLEPESPAASLPEQVHVVVGPEPSGAGWLGELRIVGANALVREVRGARCDDVVAALALITVLRLERSDASLAGTAGAVSAAGQPPAAANAETPGPPAAAALEAPKQEEPTPEEPTPEEPTPEEPAIPEEPAPEPIVEEPTLPPEKAVEEPVTREAEGDDSTDVVSEPPRGPEDCLDGSRSKYTYCVDAASTPLRLQASLFGHLGYASMPSHAFKAALGAELRLGETVASWSGALALALARGSDLSADGTSELTLLTAELRLCPPGVSLDAGFSLRGCAQLSGGRLGLSLAPSRQLVTTDAARPWAALGPSVDAGLSLSPRWTLRATSGLMLHLIRDTFGRAPTADDADPEARVPLYRPEAISLELLLGIGYTF